MKRILLLFCILTTITTTAQNYQPVQSGTIRYFTNHTGYLRGMSIDSVRTSGTDIIYYPFKTLRGAYLNNPPILVPSLFAGGSWLGNTITRKANGTCYFDNNIHDTIVVNTQANFGDTWIFYTDTAAVYYKAIVTSISVMTILGVSDTVKKISIHAYIGNTIVSTDHADGFELWLSKNHGLVKAFDLYNFPYHCYAGNNYTSNTDYYLDLIYHMQGNFTLNSSFSIIDYHVPSYIELYSQYDVGNIYQYFNHQSNSMSPGIADITIKTTIDTIFAKDVFIDSTRYSINYYEHDIYHVQSGVNTIDTTFYGSRNMFAYFSSPAWASDTPEKAVRTTSNGFLSFYYVSHDHSYCINSPTISVYTNYGFNGLLLYTAQSTYKYGIGLVRQTYHTQVPGDPTETDELTYLTKAFRNGVWCDSYGTLSVPTIGNNQHLSIYPNPATQQVTIQIHDATQYYTVSIINMMGQVVNIYQGTAEQTKIDVSPLPNGIYAVNILMNDGSRTTQTLSVQH